ncbi:MAG: site-specific integrase, partial [Anaerolineae bacterium]|nr:site-specific integrase [Anaerolineae bacterium]
IRQRTASIRSFLGWCWEERLLDEDLRHVLRLPVVKMQPQRTLTYDEIITLLADCDDSPTGIRNRAIINILLDTGLRASELCALQVENITFGVKFITPEGTVEVNRVETVVKGGHVGVGWFADETAQTLRAWLAVRERVNLFSRPEVFFSLGGNTPFKPLTSAGLRATLRKLGEAVGVEGVTTHAFRRSMACLCEEAGASSRKVAEYGRWSSLDLVQRYTQAYQAGRQFSKYSPVNYLARTQNEGAGDDH